MRRCLVFLAGLICILALSGQSYALCVKVPEANLRNGPGTKFKKTWEVFRYMPFEKVSTKGNWYKVKDVDGDTHWVYKKLVTDNFKCAVVRVDKANVRKGPGTEYNKSPLSPALKYDAFKIIENKSSWVKVVDEFSDTGWIYRNLLWIR